jgi:hypothetical protein
MPALSPMCLNNSFALHPKCLKKSYFTPKYLNKVLLSTQNVYKKAWNPNCVNKNLALHPKVLNKSIALHPK